MADSSQPSTAAHASPLMGECVWGHGPCPFLTRSKDSDVPK